MHVSRRTTPHPVVPARALTTVTLLPPPPPGALRDRTIGRALRAGLLRPQPV